MRAIGDEDLGAVDDDIVAVRRERRSHAGGVGACRWLGDRQRGKAAVDHHRQQSLLLRFGSEVDQWLDRVEVGRPDHARGRTGPGQFSHALEIGGVRHRRTPVGLGDEHGVEAQRVDRVDVVLGKDTRTVDLLRVRRDQVARECTYAFEQHLLVVGEVDREVEPGKRVHVSARCLVRRRDRSSRP